MVETGTISDAITALGTFLVAVAAIGATTAAFIGLNTWKHQSKWQTNYELSKSLLVGVKKRRDAIKHIRNPFGWSHEEELEGSDIAEDEVKWRGIQKKYGDRWDKLTNVTQDLYAQVLEAQALWGNEFQTLETRLSNLETDLLIEIQLYTEMHNPLHRGRDHFKSQDEESRNHQVVFGAGSENAFSKKYEGACSELENFLLGKFNE
jgi:hypothetical protein